MTHTCELGTEGTHRRCWQKMREIPDATLDERGDGSSGGWGWLPACPRAA